MKPKYLLFLLSLALHAEEPIDLDYLEHLPKDLLESPTEVVLDLNQMMQSFVLETKKIEIPGYPHAFNPSVALYHDALLMSFRIRDPNARFVDKIGLVFLDEEFRLLGNPQVLEIEDGSCFRYKQDPRLITVGDQLYIIYSNLIEGKTEEIRRVFVGKIHFKGNRFFADTPQPLTLFEKEGSQRWEKNWVPFDCEGDLHLAYSLNPHLIFLPFPETNSCETIACTNASLSWEWGPLRGGTPALRIGDEYLSFFHSTNVIASVQSEEVPMQHYYMGAYTFSAELPFALTRISPNPIVGPNFYEGIMHKTWKPLRVIFPGGLHLDQRYIWVFYGRQDHEIWVVKLDREALLNSLIPVVEKFDSPTPSMK